MSLRNLPVALKFLPHYVHMLEATAALVYFRPWVPAIGICRVLHQPKVGYEPKEPTRRHQPVVTL